MAGMGALALGLLVAPWVYVALGALSQFSPPFPMVATLLLIAATLDLGLEAFARPRGFKSVRVVVGGLSVLVLLTVLSVVTRFTLMRRVDQVGLFATVWLGASVVWLVVTLPAGAVGPEAILTQRLTSSGARRAALVATALLFGALAVLSYWYLTTPAGFPGGHPAPYIG